MYTYKLNRKCLLCGKPIPDQEHLTRKFCKPFKDEQGKIISHKEIFNSRRKKKEISPYIRVGMYQKKMSHNIRLLAKTKGNTVTTEELNAYNINLSRPVEFYYNANGKLLCYFVGFLLEQIDAKKFKLSEHERRY